MLLIGGFSGLSFADNTVSGATSDGFKTGKKVYNSPTSGSNRYSNGNFGAPKITGKQGEQYYTKQDLSNSASKADISGSSSYSSRENANVKLEGKKGEKYYTKQELANGQNQADRGSHVGSNQLFNYPTTKKGGSAAK